MGGVRLRGHLLEISGETELALFTGCSQQLGHRSPSCIIAGEVYFGGGMHVVGDDIEAADSRRAAQPAPINPVPAMPTVLIWPWSGPWLELQYARASPGVATLVPSSSMIFAAFSTSLPLWHGCLFRARDYLRDRPAHGRREARPGRRRGIHCGQCRRRPRSHPGEAGLSDRPWFPCRGCSRDAKAELEQGRAVNQSFEAALLGEPEISGIKDFQSRASRHRT